MARLIFQVPAVLLLRDNGTVTVFISYNQIDKQRKDRVGAEEAGIGHGRKEGG